jgi:hypothetical protein
MTTTATAKSKDPRIRQDGKDMTLGALFLVDNPPRRPNGSTSREFSTLAIGEHLKQHTYYRHEKDERKSISASKMRSHILGIWKKNAIDDVSKIPHDDHEDIVDILFRRGGKSKSRGTGLLKKEYLKKAGYDRDTFEENKLNKHESEEAIVLVPVKNTGTDGEGEEAGEEKDTSEENDRESDPDLHTEASVAEPVSTRPRLTIRSERHATPLQTSTGSHSGFKLVLGINARNPRRVGASVGEQDSPAIEEVQVQADTSAAYDDTPYASEEADSITSTEDRLGRDSVIVAGPKGSHDAVEVLDDVRLGGEQSVRVSEPGSKKRRVEENTSQADLSDWAWSPILECSDKTLEQIDQTDPDSPDKVRLDADGVVSQVTQQKKQREPPLAELNINEQGRNLKELSRDLKEAASTLLESIGQIRQEQSPLHSDATGPLETMYARCWGPDWRDMRARLRDKYLFAVPQVTTSLLAAYLYDNVLNQEASGREIREIFLGLRGTTSKAMLSIFDGRF